MRCLGLNRVGLDQRIWHCCWRISRRTESPTRKLPSIHASRNRRLAPFAPEVFGSASVYLETEGLYLASINNYSLILSRVWISLTNRNRRISPLSLLDIELTSQYLFQHIIHEFRVDWVESRPSRQMAPNGLNRP